MHYRLACVMVAACSLNVEAPAGPAACEADATCSDGYVCREQLCVPADLAKPESCATAMTAGRDHTCAVRSDGTAWCWGRNDDGQLGNGTLVDSSEPVQVALDGKVKAIAAGAQHSCAIVDADVEAGVVWCWGSNDAGRLGDGTNNKRGAPVRALDIAGAVQIVVGDAHTCARLDGGSVSCWGSNNLGQLGDDTKDFRAFPSRVKDLPPVTDLAAGGSTTCAIDAAHLLWCWGSNASGQRGNPDDDRSPVQAQITDVARVAVGAAFTCALTGAGAVSCFGTNEHRELAALGVFSSSAPLPVGVPARVVAIAAGSRFACATDEHARSWCWGENGNFQLGNDPSSVFEAPVLAYAGVTEIAGGGDHLCVRSSDDRFTCAGYNAYGQIGNGQRTTQRVPEKISGLTGVTSIDGGFFHTCATLVDGTVRCWGENRLGQLGDGSRVDRTTPVAVEGVAGARLVTAGGTHSCALIDGGTVTCWGSNDFGELGDDHTTGAGRTLARPVPGLTGVTQVAAAGGYTCAVANGVVSCWGNDRSTLSSMEPVAVALPPGVIGIAAGFAHTCALNGDHTVACWGFGDYGQIGNGISKSSREPLVVTELNSVDAISAHGDFTCAHVTADDSVRCWGHGQAGQLGTGSGSDSNTAAVVTALAGGAKLATGYNHACARRADGALACWGASDVGQLGNGSYDDSNVPVAVSGLSKVLDVAAGAGHTCAVLDDGSASVACWGDDRRGQLGDGVTALRVPVAPRLACP